MTITCKWCQKHERTDYPKKFYRIQISVRGCVHLARKTQYGNYALTLCGYEIWRHRR